MALAILEQTRMPRLAWIYTAEVWSSNGSAEPPCAVMMSASIGLRYASTVTAQKLLTGGLDPHTR